MPSGKKVKSEKNQDSAFFSKCEELTELVPELKNSVERIYPSLSELFKESIEEIAPIQRNMDANTLQRMTDERDRADQRTRYWKDH